MNTAFLIAFGGPLLIGLLGIGMVVITKPRTPQPRGADAGDSVALTLADAEKAARLAVDEIAKVRKRIAFGSERG